MVKFYVKEPKIIFGFNLLAVMQGEHSGLP
jgi:hypothetical protein